MVDFGVPVYFQCNLLFCLVINAANDLSERSFAEHALDLEAVEDLVSYFDE